MPMPPLPSAIWAVPPDPTGSAPTWTAGWASLTTPTTLTIHLPPPASASAQVDLRVFSVVRTRTVPNAFASPNPSAATPPGSSSLPPTPSAVGSGAAHTRGSGLAAWLRPPKKGPASSDAAPAAAAGPHVWQVELLAPRKGEQNTPAAASSAVRWSDADTGRSVAAAAQQTRFVFRVEDVGTAKAWAATLAPLLGVSPGSPLPGTSSLLGGVPFSSPGSEHSPKLPTPLPPPSGPATASFQSSRSSDSPIGLSTHSPLDKNISSSYQRPMNSNGTPSANSPRVPVQASPLPVAGGSPPSRISSKSTLKGKGSLWLRLRSGGTKSQGKRSASSSQTSLAAPPSPSVARTPPTPVTQSAPNLNTRQPNRVLRRPRSYGQLMTPRSPSLVQSSQSVLGISRETGPPQAILPQAESVDPVSQRTVRLVSTPTSSHRPRLYERSVLHTTAHGQQSPLSSPIPSPSFMASSSLRTGSSARPSTPTEEDIAAWLHHLRYQGTAPVHGQTAPTPMMHASSVHSGSRSRSHIYPARTLNHFTSMPSLREEPGVRSCMRGSFSYMPEVASGLAGQLVSGSSSVWNPIAQPHVQSQAQVPFPPASSQTPYEPRCPLPSTWYESDSSDEGSAALLAERERTYSGAKRSHLARSRTATALEAPWHPTTPRRRESAPRLRTASQGFGSSVFLDTDLFRPHALVLAALEADQQKTSPSKSYVPMPLDSRRSLSRDHTESELEGFGTTFGQEGVLASALLSEECLPHLGSLRV